jgi:hypothetical protein
MYGVVPELYMPKLQIIILPQIHLVLDSVG